jgi:hypothetical protein
MNSENSLLKVLSIWNETFKYTREPLSESQVIAFLKHSDAKKLSYYSEEVLRQGMKKALIQDTSKLKDIYLLVDEVNKKMIENSLKKTNKEPTSKKNKYQAEQERKLAEQLAKQEKKLADEIKNEKESNFKQTGIHETNDERADREQSEQLDKNWKLLNEKRIQIENKITELNKNQLKDIQNANSIIQIEIDNKCTTCKSTEKYSMKIPDNNFTYFVVCTKCGKEMQINASTIETIFKEKEKQKIKAEKELNKKIQDTQNIVVKDFKNKNKTVTNKVSQLKNTIKELTKEIEVRENQEEDIINSKIRRKKQELEDDINKDYLRLEQDIDKNKKSYKTSETDLINELNEKLKRCDENTLLDIEIINNNKKQLKLKKENELENKKQIETIKPSIFKNFKIKKIERKNKKLELQMVNHTKIIDEKNENIKVLKQEASVSSKKAKEELKKIEIQYAKKLDKLKTNHTEKVATLKETFELDKNLIRRTEQKSTVNLKEINSQEIIRCKEEIIKIESEFNKQYPDNKRLIEEEKKELIKNLTDEEKNYLEKQLNGLKPIEELPYEDALRRLVLFKYLNEFGVWYSGNNKSYVYFEKTDQFWDDFTGRKRIRSSSDSYFDGTRGIDDWASK